MKPDITDPAYAELNAVTEALYGVSDPELGINIIDLGLVYEIAVDQQARKIHVVMTLSTPSCPMGGMITAHVKLTAEQALPGYEADVELVWEPRWNADHISDADREALGW
jgi:metal-sulfur cluster biosynthetic enzyme